ncbi:MAG: PqqD family protein [Bacteroidia bacterium]|nr:PqqD family protein [Bacteroidia bacterium]
MKIKKNIAVSETGFVFDPTTGDSYSLNPIGAEIMTLMKEGKELPDIQKFVLDKYDVDKATFEKSYLDFMNMIRQFHLTEE